MYDVRKFTEWRCEAFDVPLYIQMQRNCLYIWHKEIYEFLQEVFFFRILLQNHVR